ncbi:RagB/SusD family nutrient uptake outer membrane protein [Terrimonas sp.]|uniref:RagB/SusD family nutrient uptake outer membrane protein n=1 Tax=Terrimonas sp. TaxID=1914338 RepID=UPI0014032EB3|nr:RagB/SusD family nutrient uptake outer membrane protein [Terrimonas sp.]
MTHWMKYRKLLMPGLCKQYFAVLVVMLLLGSCRKSLTVDQENNTVEEGYYNSAPRIQQAVIGGYTDLRRALFANYAWMMYGEARAGDLKVAVNYQQQVANQQLTAANENLVQLSDWGYFYDVIKDANDVLDIVDNAEEDILSTYQKNTYRGEALALKSMAYFYVARIWGEVPSAEENNFGAHLTAQQAVTQAMGYATEAQKLLPWRLLNDDGIESAALTAVRFSKTAVTSLIAQQALWLGNGQSAYDILTNTFTGSAADSLSGFGLAIGEDRRTEIPEAPLSKNVLSMPIATFNTIYPVGDTRRSSMFNVSGNSATLIVSDVSKVDLLRVNEIDLLLAEAAWRSDRLEEAKERLINASGGATEDYSTLTEETFGNALLQERQRQLVATGQRMFDLIRFDEVSTYIPVFTEADVANGAAYWPLSATSIKGNGWSQNNYWK